MPGGVIAVRQHDAQPGAAYILEGEIAECRDDAAGPVMRMVCAVAFEKNITHWWEHASRVKVRVLAVDIADTPRP